MKTEINPRRVLITGGSRGIGSAIFAVLLERGYEIVAPKRTELDLSNPDSVEGFIASNGDITIDVLINNAGINLLGALSEIDRNGWEIMVQTNLTSALRLVQAYAPAMAGRGWGRIVNLSSIFSVVTKERRAAYSMTKAALNALTRSIAIEYGSGGVIANALAPGYVDTELTRQNNKPEVLDAIAAAIPLRRLARPEELAKVVAFLVSDENTYMTGQTILVDGGFTCV